MANTCVCLKNSVRDDDVSPTKSSCIFFIMHLICTFSKYYGHLLQFYVCCFYLNSGFSDAFNDVSFSFCSLAPPVARIIHPSLLALSFSLRLCLSASLFLSIPPPAAASPLTWRAGRSAAAAAALPSSLRWMLDVPCGHRGSGQLCASSSSPPLAGCARPPDTVREWTWI